MKGWPIAILITVSSLLTGCGSQFQCVEGRGCDGRTIVCVCTTNEANANCDEGVLPQALRCSECPMHLLHRPGTLRVLHPPVMINPRQRQTRWRN
jgi:hypothetical protein